ncbi:phytanoyl-CoA dioxygenase family protein [Nocardia sp. alder85J]|uniref:phytanoyl-CoA dioxygenase family protein n=1 Tax=Nocardia sp. alder85J TaxID=2862949 RepID=UPI0022529048|nr:phytanoyl-CoA dioxygenase family protein [Nocardia sp. alder85J]MCX4094333.1 phytanoyl-CoA dioxygenase family protein [Nocardia sp. alder85J]
MVSVDFRTRSAAVGTVDLVTFRDHHLPDLLDRHGRAAGAAARRLSLPPLTLRVGGEQLTFVPGDELTVRPDASAELLATLDPVTFSDLVQDVVSLFGAQMTGRAELVHGTVAAFVEWEPVLRCLIDGRPVHRPGDIGFRDRTGGPLDPRRSFTLDDDPAEYGHFLAEAGYLHLRGVFTEAEMAAVSAELDTAIAAAARDDGASWWARTEPGGWYPARILGFNHQSATLRELLTGPRFRSLAGCTDDTWVQRDPLLDDAAEGLLKKVGVVEGASDVSWHKDCTMGGHSHHCAGLVVGISVTGAGPETGELGVVPGSHRANIATLGIEGLDLTALPLPTRPGDLTVHLSCTLHMSRPPVGGERRVVYTGFGLAPRPGHETPALDRTESRRRRAELSDRVIGHQRTGGPDRARLASHEL